MKIFSMKEYIRMMKSFDRENISVFLGAGASVQSQIPSAKDLVWQFKRTLYCNENNMSEQYFKDIQSLEGKRKIQGFFDGLSDYPADGDSREYSFYFEKCYQTILSRRNFISKIVSNKLPSNGYLCLASLIKNGYIKDAFTTNFDSLIESALNIINPTYRNVTISSSLNPQIDIVENAYKIIQLHGDYLYDKIQNTEEELRMLESRIAEFSYNQLSQKQLLVVGYSGNDDSIMEWLIRGFNDSSFLSKGVSWCVLKGQVVSDKVRNVLTYAEKLGKEVNLVEITDFDDFFYNMYLSLDLKEEYIESLGRKKSETNRIDFLSSERKYPFVKFNAFELCTDLYNNTIKYCKTKMESFNELRELICDKPVVATLKKGNIYFIGEERFLSDKIDKNISTINLNSCFLERENSLEYQLLYDMIFLKLSQNAAFERVSKRKIRLTDSKKEYKNKAYVYYEALNIYLNSYSNRLFLILEPTVDVQKVNGEPLQKVEKQEIFNDILSKRRNSEFSENLMFWQRQIYKFCSFDFSLGEFDFKFNSIALSQGGTKREKGWPTIKAFEFNEPQMQSCYGPHVNQLVGLIEDGPYDYLYSKNRESIRLAILSNKNFYFRIFNHLKSLNETIGDKESDGFVKEYPGFESVYRKSLDIPTEFSSLSVLYSEPFDSIKTAQEYYSVLTSRIKSLFDKRNDFDVLIVYIPNEAKRLRKNGVFDLHDAIKLFCANNQIKVQLVEDKSINHMLQLKVKWGLSSGIYAKANGELWQPKYFNDDTAFIGISYSMLPNGNYYVGCSQLFDSCGNGMRLIVNQLRDPRIIRKNPHMTKEDASYIVGNLLRAYYHSSPINKIKRIVVHKTTPFTSEEIEGINLALSGIEKVELIQIQEFTGWRGIQFKSEYDSGAHGFAIKRGTTVQLDNNSLLLWTHGCVKDVELKGNFNYYKGGRGIPIPIVIRRFQGDSSGDMLVNELLMLTKMNWNSGDSLYKNLPVTIDFSKVVARMSKQNMITHNKSYDFRYFM